MYVEQQHQVPLKFLCKLSGQIMVNPVKLSDGDVYDREAIEHWFKEGNITNPITGQDLLNYDLIPSIALQAQIEKYKREHKQSFVQKSPKKFRLMRQRNQQNNKKIKDLQYRWFTFMREFKIHEQKVNQLLEKIDEPLKTEEGSYRGQSILGSLQGDGLMEFKNGDRYLGQWKNNKMEGYGKKFIFMDNLYYFGEWKNGQLNGMGCVRPKNERHLMLYKGQWENGQRSGIGIFYDPYQRLTYRGQFKNNKRNGKGEQIIKNGDIFEGQWKNGMKDGEGIRYTKDGEIRNEFWKQNKKVEPKQLEEKQNEEVEEIVVEREQKSTICDFCKLI